jgi:hypothetical protein
LDQETNEEADVEASGSQDEFQRRNCIQKYKKNAIDNQKHEQRIRCSKIAPYEITSIYNPPEDGP